MATEENFSELLKELETIVDRLTKEDVDLEEGLKEFEKGLKIFTKCQKKLTEIEAKTKVLMEENGEFFLREEEAL